MTGGTRNEWDSLAKEVQATIAKTRVDGGNYLACGCGSNKFVSFKSRLRCELCGELYQKRERSFAKRELFTKHEQTGELNMSGGMEESAWTYGNPSFELRTGAKDSEDQKKSALNTQVGGDHYRKMKIQPIEYILANELNFSEGNIVKLISRHRLKGGAQDIQKIKQYCDFLLESEYREEA